MKNNSQSKTVNLYIQKAQIGEEFERFTALKDCVIKHQIQKGILLKSHYETLVGKYAYSLHGLDDPYFLCHDMQMYKYGAGKNGNDSIDNIKFHDDFEYLNKFKHMKSGAGPIDYFSIYEMQLSEDGLCLTEILRWNTDTKAEFATRVIYQDKSISVS